MRQAPEMHETLDPRREIIVSDAVSTLFDFFFLATIIL
jgi:hypothetical protein